MQRNDQETFFGDGMKRKTETGNATFTFFRPMEIPRLRKRVKYWFLNGICKCFLRITSPADPAGKKYHIAVCQIFKDEASYLREWIEYHVLIGVEHFYLYDNNSSDGYGHVLQPYLDRGIVTLIKWPKNQAQVEAYEDCIRRFRDESDWIGFLDVDEFVVPVEAHSLKKFLDMFSRTPAVLLYWRFFGSGGRIDRDLHGLVTEDFTVASAKLYTKGKCFYNTHYDYLWNDPKNGSMFHMLWTKVCGHSVPPADIFGRFLFENYYPATKKEIPVQLNHYAVKSFMEHREKDKKGDVFYSRPTHGDSVFFGRDERCSVPDYQIYKYLTRLKIRLQDESLQKRSGAEGEQP